jgi:hypothetical protein
VPAPEGRNKCGSDRGSTSSARADGPFTSPDLPVRMRARSPSVTRDRVGRRPSSPHTPSNEFGKLDTVSSFMARRTSLVEQTGRRGRAEPGHLIPRTGGSRQPLGPTRARAAPRGEMRVHANSGAYAVLLVRARATVRWRPVADRSVRTLRRTVLDCRGRGSLSLQATRLRPTVAPRTRRGRLDADGRTCE